MSEPSPIQTERQQQADAVYRFVVQYIEVHHTAPTLQQCVDGCRISAYRVKGAITRLRDQKRLSSSTLRPLNEGSGKEPA